MLRKTVLALGPTIWQHGVCTLFAAVLLGLSGAVAAADVRPSAKVARLGYVTDRAGPSEFDEAFLQGMRYYASLSTRAKWEIVISAGLSAGDMIE